MLVHSALPTVVTLTVHILSGHSSTRLMTHQTTLPAPPQTQLVIANHPIGQSAMPAAEVWCCQFHASAQQSGGASDHHACARHCAELHCWQPQAQPSQLQPPWACPAPHFHWQHYCRAPQTLHQLLHTGSLQCCGARIGGTTATRPNMGM